MKVAINETTLTAIGDAIREMTGKSDLIAPAAMPTEIRGIETGGGGSIEVEPIVLTDNCEDACRGVFSGKYIDLFGNTITTKDISNASYMFHSCSANEIPFDINISNSFRNLEYMFYLCSNLKQLPLIKGNITPPTGNYSNNPSMNSMFYGLYNVRYIPYDYFDNFGSEEFWTAAQQYGAKRSSMFGSCYSLRQLPDISKLSTTASYYNCFYYGAFAYCYALDEITNLPVLNADYTNSTFDSIVSYCCRLKNFIFQTNEDGTPKTANWKNQTIALTSYSNPVGCANYASDITNYNSGITADKEVKDDATYQALKNDPDWFTCNVRYGRYNHDSAVNTINSLPDTSAYLATAGGTNTIQFYGITGEYTDGGAINTLTEEEIAVAAAKGWTVSFT